MNMQTSTFIQLQNLPELHRYLKLALPSITLTLSCLLLASDAVIAKCRAPYWFWDSVVLWQTLALTVAQVLATSLDAYFQLTIMLMILVVGLAMLAHLRPFRARQSQTIQVCTMYVLPHSAKVFTLIR